MFSRLYKITQNLLCTEQDSTAVKDFAEQPSEEPQSLAKREESPKGPIPLAEIQKLFAEYPNLRAKLREIHNITLEEEWDAEQKRSTYHRGDRQAHNHHHHHNNRGTWTAEKGFNRGVEKLGDGEKAVKVESARTPMPRAL